MTQFLTFGLLAMSLDLLGDRAGLVSFGHGAWFGLGAYTLALTLERLPGVGGTYLGFLLAALVGGGFAALLGSQLFLGRQRVGGVYFGIITLAVAAILQLVVMGWSSFTGGSNGLYGFATPELAPGLELAGTRTPYVLTAAVCVLIYYGLRWALGSSLGLSLLAARQNPKTRRGRRHPAGALPTDRLPHRRRHRRDRRGALCAGRLRLARSLRADVQHLCDRLDGPRRAGHAHRRVPWRDRVERAGNGAQWLLRLALAADGGDSLIVVVLAWPRGAMGALAAVTRAVRS